MVDPEKFKAMIGMLKGQNETCKPLIKGDGPQAFDAIANPEAFVHMYQECYRILGMESRFAEYVRDDV